MSDAKIIPLTRKEQHTFASMMRPHFEALYRVAFRFSGNTADAEDLVQDLLVRLYPRMDELRQVERLRPWLIRVMYRMFIDRLRRRNRSPIQSLESCIAYGDEKDPYENFETKAAGPQDTLQCNEEQKRLILALNQLADKHRHVVILHDVEGYTLEEMQEVFECPIGTLKSRLHRARLKLRALLVAEGKSDGRKLYRKQRHAEEKAIDNEGHEADSVQQFQKKMDRQVGRHSGADYACKQL